MSDMQDRADSDPLLSAIEAEENICDLLNHMFDGEKVESVLINGLSVIQTLLEFRKIGRPEDGHDQMTSLDAERFAVGVRSTLNAVTPRLKDFHQVLLEPPKQHYLPMPTTIGSLEQPLGNTRLQLVRLITSILLTNTPAVNSELARLGTVSVLLDLYFKYVWNNFLHTQVELCISTILNNSPIETEEGKIESPLLQQLFTECKIIDRILEAWDDNEQQQNRPNGRRRGYMGHLTKIANYICEQREKGSERIKELFQELSEETQEKWETFVSGTLSELNKQNAVDLVGSHIQSSSEDDDADFRDIPFPQDTAMQQAYSDYQLQPMTRNFVDQFGFKEDEFTDQEERVNAPFNDRISSINFDINVDDPTSASIFEQACNERMQQFDDNDEVDDDELWETKEITFSKTPSSGTQATSSSNVPTRMRDLKHASDDEDEEDNHSDDSTDSEDDLQSPRIIHQTPTTTTENMEVDSSDNFANFAEMMDSSSQGADAMDTGSPWENIAAGGGGGAAASSTTGNDGEEGWAKFQDIETTGQDSNSAVSSSNSGSNGGFADFSTIQDNLNVTSPELRDSIDVDMESSVDQQPNSNRGAAYLVTSAPADLANEVSDAAAAAGGQDETASSSTDSPPSQPKTAWEGEETPSSSSPPSEAAAAADSTQSPSKNSVEPAISSSSEASSSSAAADTQENSQPEDDDLANNFDFLTSSGMLGKSESKEDNAEVSSSGDTSVDDIRAQAKEALEEFTAVTSNNTLVAGASPTSSHNGPI